MIIVLIIALYSYSFVCYGEYDLYIYLVNIQIEYIEYKLCIHTFKFFFETPLYIRLSILDLYNKEPIYTN